MAAARMLALSKTRGMVVLRAPSAPFGVQHVRGLTGIKIL
eukprot:CAMPEP_0117571750 /NCGR_PEP_ID=MMETSP0784-20121206/59940_1 /TAXON_ID=39447 /ORGANISM="" /LENGTH=39 /DNA_ID= /DNA_START= /DNA_END= /DNA_ORIENTATION=